MKKNKIEEGNPYEDWRETTHTDDRPTEIKLTPEERAAALKRIEERKKNKKD